MYKVTWMLAGGHTLVWEVDDDGLSRLQRVWLAGREILWHPDQVQRQVVRAHVSAVEVQAS